MKKIVGTLLKISAVLIVVAVIFMMIGMNSMKADDKKAADSSPGSNVVFDAMQIAGISEKELISLLGEPKQKEEWNWLYGDATYPVTTFEYQDGQNSYEVLIYEAKVIRLNYFSEKYNNINGKSLTYKKKTDLLRMFNITAGDELQVKGDTGYALRFGTVNEKIADFWVALMDDEAKTVDEVKITYDKRFSE